MSQLKTQMLLQEILSELRKISKNTSKKLNKKHNLNPGLSPFNLDEIYKFYPRKEGKTGGIRILSRDIKDRKDYEDLRVAVDNYTKQIRDNKTDRKFIKLFSTFATCWRDYVYIQDQQSNHVKNITVEEPTRFLI